MAEGGAGADGRTRAEMDRMLLACLRRLDKQANALGLLQRENQQLRDSQSSMKTTGSPVRAQHIFIPRYVTDAEADEKKRGTEVRHRTNSSRPGRPRPHTARPRPPNSTSTQAQDSRRTSLRHNRIRRPDTAKPPATEGARGTSVQENDLNNGADKDAVDPPVLDNR